MQRASNSATVEPLTSSLVGDIDMILCLIWYGLTANSVVILIITTAFPSARLMEGVTNFRPSQTLDIQRLKLDKSLFKENSS